MEPIDYPSAKYQLAARRLLDPVLRIPDRVERSVKYRLLAVDELQRLKRSGELTPQHLNFWL